MTITNMQGKRFGKLTIIEDSGQRKRECILWRCRCDCGNEILLTRNRLTSGIVTNCGCVPVDPEDPHNQDLTGRVFGDLKVLGRDESNERIRSMWRCQCKCGKIVVVSGVRLKAGQVQSCGCRRNGPAPNRIDLAGRRFGRLTVLYDLPRIGRDSPIYWHCRCDCGNEVDIMAAHLLRNVTLSCGCLNQERRSDMHKHLHYENDTCLERLIRAQTNPKQNTSGFRGVTRVPSGRWRATITFRKVHYSLGSFRTFDEAVNARLNAERHLHAGFLQARKIWDERAAADPQWGEENPFYYNVTFADQQFSISTNGTAESD